MHIHHLLYSAVIVSLGLIPLSQAITVDSDCDAYPFVKGSITNVFNWAREAAEELEKTPMDPNVATVAGWIFGDPSNWGEASTRLRGVGNIPQGSEPQNPNEMFVFCSNSRFVQPNPPRPDGALYDTRSGAFEPVNDNYRSCFDPNWVEAVAGTRTKAMTNNYWAGNVQTDVQFCPWYLEFVKSNNFQSSVYLEPPDWKCRLARGLESVVDGKTDMDHASFFEDVFLHELTHHKAVAEPQRRLGVPETYGWSKVVAAKEPRNSESLSFFALSVNLLRNCGNVIMEDGTLLQPDQVQRLLRRAWENRIGMPWSA